MSYEYDHQMNLLEPVKLVNNYRPSRGIGGVYLAVFMNHQLSFFLFKRPEIFLFFYTK